MLDKVLTHVGRRQRDTDQDVAEVLVEAMQLHKALLALDMSLGPPNVLGAESYPSPETSMPSQGVEGGRNQCALALCCSARFLLYSEYGCSEFNGRTPSHERVALESEAQGVAIRGIEVMATVTVPEMARAVVQTLTAAATRPSINPLLGHTLYYAATECACFIRESHMPSMCAALAQIIQGLEAMRSEWRVGGTFCLERLDLSHAMADHEQRSIYCCWRRARFWNW